MIILHSQNFNLAQEIAKKLSAKLLDKNSKSNFFSITKPTKTPNLTAIRKQYRVDINHYPEHFAFAKTALLISDMDSTLITIECIDEMAKYYGVGAEVVHITRQAMLGELDFATALKARLSLLKGLMYGDLERIYQQKLCFSPGVKSLINFIHRRDIKSALVSGAFDFFAKRITDELNISYFLSNTLEIKNGQLTGRVIGDIVDGTKKQAFLNTLCQQLNCELSQSIAIGDGSNDLPMLQSAGLSVAYHAKPLLKDKADIIIDYGGLDLLIDFF